MISATLSSPALFYPFTLGMLAAVNPCGFPLLLCYLEYLCGWKETSSTGEKAARAVVGGGLATAGFLTVFGALGITVEAGWNAISSNAYSSARWVMVALGVAMIAFAIASLARGGVGIRLPHIGAGFTRHPRAGMYLFGISYAIGSLGCSLPLFITGVSSAFGVKRVGTGVEVFISYALGMGCVFGAVAVATALSATVARPLRKASRFVPWVGGVLLLLDGVYLTWYWSAAIANPTGNIPPERFVSAVQQGLSRFIDSNARVVGVVLGAAVVIAVIAWGLFERSGGSKEPAS